MADINIDFGLLRAPNILGNYLQGRQYRQQEQQNMLAQQRQQRLDARDTEKFAREKQQWQREDETQAGRKNALGLVATGDMTGARAAAYKSGDMDTINLIRTMDKDTREQAALKAEHFAQVAFSLKRLPPEQRKAALAQVAPQLVQYGLTQEQLASFDPNDASLDAVVAQAMDLKDQIAMADKEADNKRADAQAAEAARHNKASEGVAYGNLAVSRSNSARGWAAHNARLKAGGYGTPGVGGSNFAPGDVQWDDDK